MRRSTSSLLLPALLTAFGVFAASPMAHACAVCFGESDSPLAAGMSWGIFALLVVVVMVLIAIASFFVALARRAEAAESPGPAANETDLNQLN